jgi:hypothetical protein
VLCFSRKPLFLRVYVSWTTFNTFIMISFFVFSLLVTETSCWPGWASFPSSTTSPFLPWLSPWWFTGTGWPRYSPPFIACFLAQICRLLCGKWKIVVTSEHEHWRPCIVRCFNSNYGLTIVWFLTMDSEDSQWMSLRWHWVLSFDAVSADDTIFDNKNHYSIITIWSTTNIFSYYIENTLVRRQKETKL